MTNLNQQTLGCFGPKHCFKGGIYTSVAVLAEIPLKSPRKLFIFIIKKYIYRIKVSKKTNYLILKKTSLIYTMSATDVGPNAQAGRNNNNEL